MQKNSDNKKKLFGFINTKKIKTTLGLLALTGTIGAIGGALYHFSEKPDDKKIEKESEIDTEDIKEEIKNIINSEIETEDESEKDIEDTNTVEDINEKIKTKTNDKNIVDNDKNNVEDNSNRKIDDRQDQNKNDDSNENGIGDSEEEIKEKESENETEKNSEKESESETEKNSEKETESETEKNSEKESESETEKNSEKESESETEKNSEKETESETEKNSEKETESETEKNSEKESETEKNHTHVYKSEEFVKTLASTSWISQDDDFEVRFLTNQYKKECIAGDDVIYFKKYEKETRNHTYGNEEVLFANLSATKWQSVDDEKEQRTVTDLYVDKCDTCGHTKIFKKDRIETRNHIYGNEVKGNLVKTEWIVNPDNACEKLEQKTYEYTETCGSCNHVHTFTKTELTGEKQESHVYGLEILVEKEVSATNWESINDEEEQRTVIDKYKKVCEKCGDEKVYTKTRIETRKHIFGEESVKQANISSTPWISQDDTYETRTVTDLYQKQCESCNHVVTYPKTRIETRKHAYGDAVKGNLVKTEWIVNPDNPCEKLEQKTYEYTETCGSCNHVHTFTKTELTGEKIENHNFGEESIKQANISSTPWIDNGDNEIRTVTDLYQKECQDCHYIATYPKTRTETRNHTYQNAVKGNLVKTEWIVNPDNPCEKLEQKTYEYTETCGNCNHIHTFTKIELTGEKQANHTYGDEMLDQANISATPWIDNGDNEIRTVTDRYKKVCTVCNHEYTFTKNRQEEREHLYNVPAVLIGTSASAWESFNDEKEIRTITNTYQQVCSHDGCNHVKTYTEDVPEYRNHTYGDEQATGVITSATDWVNAGDDETRTVTKEYKKTCDTCGHIITYTKNDIVEHRDHVFSETSWHVDPSNPTVEVRECENGCGKTETRDLVHTHSFSEEFSMEGSTNSISGHCGRWYKTCTDCGETVYAKGKVEGTNYADGEYESHELVYFNSPRQNTDGTYDYTLKCKNCNAKKTYRDQDTLPEGIPLPPTGIRHISSKQYLQKLKNNILSYFKVDEKEEKAKQYIK